VPPGPEEQDFTFFTAIWGLSEAINCKAKSWNVQKKADSKRRQLDLGDGKHGHDTTGRHFTYPRTLINDGNTILVGREAIPSFVKDQKDQDVLIFEASSQIEADLKYEEFMPTVY